MPLFRLVFVLLVLAGGSPAFAMGGLVDLRVVDRADGPLPEHFWHGQAYVAGQPDRVFELALTNLTGRRVLAVVSVDGVNAVSGETAAPDQTGYVLEPFQSYRVKGWRKSAQEVAQFYFTSVRDSYAGRTGRPTNTGVIGLAVFRERLVLPQVAVPLQAPYLPDAGGGARAKERGPMPVSPDAASSIATQAQALESRSEATGADARARLPNKLGTGHGARERSAITMVEFQRESVTPAEAVSVFYDSKANLMAKGILPRPAPVPSAPNPFPGSFVPDPRY